MKARMHFVSRFLLVGSLFLMVGMLPVCSAQQASITILQPQAIITGTLHAGTRTYHNYTFVFTIRNDGDAVSDNITVSFSDSDLPPEVAGKYVLGNCTLGPGETKSFTKTNHPIASQGAFYINVSFAPTTAKPSLDNTGEKSFLFGGSTEKKSTPGFECAVVILALGVTMLLVRRKH